MTATTAHDDIRHEALASALSSRYLAYALSTITQRALPDARDGLKPVHRRLLHAMRLLGLNPASGFKKCARVVGDVIGKYHPHGDTAVYEALVRLAQDFAVRYPLVDGQGNFGNIDGDSAAAMRYTESRMTAAAELLLAGLDEDAVDFRPTYDGEEDEPIVLPAAFPNLLANGSNGIAVGMATSIPPHNMAELVAACTALIKKPDMPEEGLLKFVKGPDFPTGGIIVDSQEAIAEAYRTGRGSFRVRARWHKEEGQRGTYQIVIDQIPYQVQKAKLIERIAELIEQKKAPLLDDVRDESAEDVRVVLVPKNRTIEPELLMEQLFRLSDLESRIPLNMNVLDNGLVPRVMSLKDALMAFIHHRYDVLERRTTHRLEKIATRLEVLEGYLAAFLNLDRVIEIIRTEDEPKQVMMKEFGLTDNQAEAILNMRLRALRKLEEMQIRGEHTALSKEQAALQKMLASDALKAEKLIAELAEVDAKFGAKTEIGKRRSTFADLPDIAEEALAIENMVEREPITVVCSQKGWLRSFKNHIDETESIKYREGDKGRFWIKAETTDKLMVLSTDGRFYTLDCSKLPGGRGGGEAIRSFVDMPPEADIVTMFVHVPGRKLLLAATTGHGFITAEDDAVAMTKAGRKVMNVKTPGEACVCRFVSGDSVAVIGENHKLLVFPLADLPELARGQGVFLQRYKGGNLLDCTTFTWEDGLKDENNRTFSASDLKDWKGERAGAGRLKPRGFAQSGRFAS